MTRSRLRLIVVALATAAILPAAAATSEWVGDGHAAVRLLTARDGLGRASLKAGLAFRFAPGWHGYWRTPGDSGIPPAFDWSGTPGLKDVTVDWPAPSRLVVSDLQNGVYTGHVLLPVTLAFFHPPAAGEVRVAVDYAACANICVPMHADLLLTLPADNGAESSEAALIAAAEAGVPRRPADAGLAVRRQEIVGAGADRRLVVDLASTAAPFDRPDLFIENFGEGLPPSPRIVLGDGGRSATLTVPLPARPDGSAPPAPAAPLILTLVDGPRSAVFAGPPPDAVPAAAEGGQFAWALASAVIGGLVLNLMPCVLPVLSLKLAGLVRHSGDGLRIIRIGFAATGFGIVTSFLALAGLLVVLKASGAAIGWGIQFQQPAFLAILATLTTLFAANLFDWIHIGIPSRVANLQRRGPRTAWVQPFLTGVLATLLATPCSAPFVGTAVGFALARGPADILAIFLGLGLGMALPFFVAALVPGVAGWLPRPGAWMITLRRGLGVLLLVTAGWLLAVLDGVAGPATAAAVALLLGTLLVVLGSAARRVGSDRRNRTGAAAGGLALLALAVSVAVPQIGRGPVTDFGDAVAFDPDAIGPRVAAGGTVLVDVSARWCLTCKVNELAALKTAEVRSRLARPGTIVMRADWTRPDATIGRYIRSFARYGIPLDVVYGPRRPSGELLPELLTPSVVVAALDRASAVQARAEVSR